MTRKLKEAWSMARKKKTTLTNHVEKINPEEKEVSLHTFLIHMKIDINIARDKIADYIVNPTRGL